MHGHPTDRLVAGSIVGAIFTAVLVLLLIWLDIPPEKKFSLALRLALPVAIAAVALLFRPLLLKTVWRDRRDPTMLEEDINLLLIGRMLGVVGGFFFGVTLVTQLL